MQEIKNIIGIVAVILSLVGYVPYIRDTIKGKTTPHIYTWFIWGLVTAIAFALQVSGGAGVGSWVTLVVAIICFFIVVLGLHSGKKDITKIDTIFLVFALVALCIWLFLKQPIISIILVSSIDMLGFVPTIRKSWNKPYSETLFMYELSALRHGLSVLALQQYSIVTWLYPVSWVFANGLFALMLIVRRKQLNGN